MTIDKTQIGEDVLLLKELDDNNKLVGIGFRVPNKEYQLTIENFLIQEGIPITERAWRSRYNSYVVYDYEPFCADGFNRESWIAPDHLNFEFVLSLIEKHISKVDRLNALLEI